MDNRIVALRKRYEQAVGQRDQLAKSLSDTETLIKEKEIYLEQCGKARLIMQTVSEQTQKKIELHIGTLVSMALASVFPDPYTFVLRFVKRREKMEADLLFVKGENEGSPLDVSGGGPLDVASFALRLATWAIHPSRNVLLLDEPFKFVSRNLQSKCSEMLKYLSTTLGMQMIINSHIPEIIDCADKVYEVSKPSGESIVKEVSK